MSTPNLGLVTVTSAAGSAVTFLNYRLDMSNDANSNMTKIDAFAGNVSASMATLLSSISYLVNATESGTNNYVATVTGFTSYTDGKLIDLVLDVTQSGTTTLNINSLGTKSLYKITSNGTATNLSSGDLVAGRANFFMYNLAGGYWLWVNGTSADQINIAGNVNNIPIITGSGIGDSGISASSLGLVDGYYVVSQLSSRLQNESLITAGSGIGIVVDTSSSRIYVKNNIVAGNGIALNVDTSTSAVTIVGTAASNIAPPSASYVVFGTLDSTLTNEKIITPGSGILIENNTAASKIYLHNNIIAGSGINITNNTAASSLTIANNSLTTDDGWTNPNSTWTYYSASAIGIPNASSILSVGDKLKYTASGSTIYQYVISTSASIAIVTGGTDYVVPNTTLTNNYYSHHSSPFGFPQWFNYTPTGIASSNVILSGRFSINSRICSVQFRAIFTNKITFTTMPTLPVTSSPSLLSTGVGQFGVGYYSGAILYGGMYSNVGSSASTFTLAKTDGTNMSATVPVTWDNNYNLSANFYYEI